MTPALRLTLFMICAVVSTAGVTLTAVVAAQNFDCGAPQGVSQRTVCDTPKLLALDAEMRSAVEALGDKAGAQEAALRQINIRLADWLKRVERQCGARQACLASSYRRGIRSLQQELSRAERKARPATPKAPAPAASQQAQVLLAALTETVRSSIAELVKQHDISRPKWSLIELKIVFSRLDRAAKDKLVAEVWDARTNLQADLFLRELATGPKAYPQAMGRGGKGTLPFGVERGRFPLGGKGTLPF